MELLTDALENKQKTTKIQKSRNVNKVLLKTGSYVINCLAKS